MNPLPIELTPHFLAAIVGALLSLSFTYIPGWRVRYGGLTSEIKSLIMLGCLTVATIVLYFLVKFGVLVPTQPVNVWTFLWMLYLALTGNQITYKISPLPGDVLNAKATRRLRDVDYTDAG